MSVKSLIAAVCGTILKVAAAVAVIMLIYRGSILAYDYGYRIFEEPAVSAGEGRVVSVTIPEDMSAGEMGQLFLSKGLIRDDRLFVLQYYFSEYRQDLKSGDFELSTAMTVEEMMETMTKEPEPPAAEEPTTEGEGDALPEDDDAGDEQPAGAE